METLIRDYLINEIGLSMDSKFSNNENLLALGLDSIKLFKLVTFIEDCFAIAIDNIDIEPNNFSSIEKISQLIGKYKNEL